MTAPGSPTPQPKPRRIKEGSREYRRREIETALAFCPKIEPCEDCGSPCVRGYRCDYCDPPNGVTVLRKRSDGVFVPDCEHCGNQPGDCTCEGGTYGF